MKILVSGLMNVESCTNVHVFPVGYTRILYPFNDVDIQISGSGYRVSAAMAALGDNVIPATIIGKDALGRMIRAEVASLGMPTEYLFPWLEKTCSSTVLMDNTGRRKKYCDLKNVQEMTLSPDCLGDDLRSADALVLCNSNFNAELLSLSAALGKPVFTDVHAISSADDPYNSRFLAAASVAFLSDEELFSNHEEFLRSLYETYHNRILVLGQGSKGAMMLDAESRTIWFVSAVHPRDAVCSIGAGDALSSCFIHYYLKGLAPLECLKRAMLFAAWKLGDSACEAGCLNEAALEDLYGKTEYQVSEIAHF